MSVFMSILKLLAGVGVFLAGMRFMSEGLQQSAGGGVKQMFARFSDKRLVGYGIGTGVTAIIQSSDATTVMTMGLVNAGIMKLRQATSVVLGAKLGTTITGVIVALSAFSTGGFSFNTFFAAVSAVGVGMIVFTKKDKINRIGRILMGFGFIFVGLIMMCESMVTDEINGFFVGLFTAIRNPILLLLMSVAFTGLIQSSSAATGIYIALVGAGTMTTFQALFLVMGANVGTCVTAIWAAIGASADTKRVAFLHITTAAFGALVFSILLTFFGKQASAFLDSAISLPEWRIALFNVVFNLTYTLLLLPFVGKLEQLARLCIKDTSKKEQPVVTFIDDRMLETPSIAVAQVQKEILRMANLSKANLGIAIKALGGDMSQRDTLIDNEQTINTLNREIASFLIKISTHGSITAVDEKLVGSLHHVISDIERIGDHARNFVEFADELNRQGCAFSADAQAELAVMYGRVSEMFDLGLGVIESRDRSGLKKLVALEDEVDALKRVYGEHHIKRLHEGACTIESGMYYYDV
ncbi:MAG: Na/Pi cotransporter family protein, partial [Clostridiales bacterium]|nr:Na/Pi cotransporter family protein [Clostridiales bacterium]